jgi:hypothetical protein
MAGMQGLIDRQREDADSLLTRARSESLCTSRAMVAVAKKLRRRATHGEAAVRFFLEWKLRESPPVSRSRSQAYSSISAALERHTGPHRSLPRDWDK